MRLLCAGCAAPIVVGTCRWRIPRRSWSTVIECQSQTSSPVGGAGALPGDRAWSGTQESSVRAWKIGVVDDGRHPPRPHDEADAGDQRRWALDLRHLFGRMTGSDTARSCQRHDGPA